MKSFGNLDILITLRCNASCKNCIEFCNSYDRTGLDFTNMDMSLEQIKLFCEETRIVWGKQTIPLWGRVVITGGEPLLHPDVIEISKLLSSTLIVDNPIAEQLQLNTNMSLPIPNNLACPVINYSTLDNKPQIHNVTLLHPDDMNCARPTFLGCGHYRKATKVLSKHGFSMCCAGDGYIRIFGLELLILDHLPTINEEWYKQNMDLICQHCPFGCTQEVFERDMGIPISNLYREQANLNKSGRVISKVYGRI